MPTGVLLVGVLGCRPCSLFNIRVKVNPDTKIGNNYIDLDNIYLDDRTFTNSDSILVDEINLDRKTLVDSESDVVNEDSYTNSDLINNIDRKITLLYTKGEDRKPRVYVI